MPQNALKLLLLSFVRPRYAADHSRFVPLKILIPFFCFLVLLAPYLISMIVDGFAIYDTVESLWSLIVRSHQHFYRTFLREGYDETGIPLIFPAMYLLITFSITLALACFFSPVVVDRQQPIFQACYLTLKRLTLLVPSILFTIIITVILLSALDMQRDRYA